MNKKKFLVLIYVALLYINSYANNDSLQEKDQSNSVLTINNKILSFTLKDQYNNKHTLTSKTKIILFAFSKSTSDIMNLYMSTKKFNHLTSREILYIADISGMPSLVTKLFALPLMKKNKYPIMLIYKKIDALQFRYENHQDKIMIISLDNQIVKGIKFVTNKDDLNDEINKVQKSN